MYQKRHFTIKIIKDNNHCPSRECSDRRWGTVFKVLTFVKQAGETLLLALRRPQDEDGN